MITFGRVQIEDTRSSSESAIDESDSEDENAEGDHKNHSSKSLRGDSKSKEKVQ